MKSHIRLLALLTACIAGQAAELMTTSDAAQTLRKVAQAARVSNYSGTYLYQNNGVVQTLRLLHSHDTSGEHERRETLDGEAREFIRHNDKILCYLPDSPPVAFDRRTANKFFPGVIPDQIADVLNSYNFRRLGVDRVAGHECQSIKMEPKDNLRNARTLCIEPNSSLLLRMTVLSPDQRQIVEQFAFTQLDLGVTIDKRLLKSNLASRATTAPPNKRQQASADADFEYELRNLPNGFHLIKQTTALLPGRADPVQQFLFSDGFATVSVFVEPSTDQPLIIPNNQGGVSIYARQQGEWRITALGEVPLVTVQMFTQSFSFR